MNKARDVRAVRYFSNDKLVAVCQADCGVWLAEYAPDFMEDTRLVHGNHLDKFLDHMNNDVQVVLESSLGWDAMVSVWEDPKASILEVPQPKEGEVWLVRSDKLPVEWVGFFKRDAFYFASPCDGPYVPLRDVTPIERLYRKGEI